MLGIDIIDLNDPLFRERNKSTLRFISHPDDSCFESENEFWHFWTAKEAVFKSNRELTTFLPKNVPVQITAGKENEITFKSGRSVSGRIFAHDGFIIAVASAVKVESIDYHIFRKKTKNDSLEARETIEQYFVDHMNLKVKVVNDGNGLPVLDYKNLPLSISHHGKFIAFAYHKW